MYGKTNTTYPAFTGKVPVYDFASVKIREPSFAFKCLPIITF